MTGAPPDRSAASLEDSASSRLSRRKAAPRPSSSPAASPSRASWAGFGELGEVAARAEVTSSTPLVAAAPLTSSWATSSLSTACWLISALTWVAVPVLPCSDLICLPSELICLCSVACAVVRLFMAVFWVCSTKALA